MSKRNGNLAIFSGQIALSLMQSTMMFYYVKVFLNVFHVNEYWFNLAQLLFMFWNAINDPLFGYIQDIGGSWMRDRAKIFTYFGPLMTASFLILWFPWRSGPNSPTYVEGMHLIVGLFLYDAFYSCIGVAWSALFTEVTRTHGKRVKGLKYSQVAILLSVNIITVTEKISHSLDNYSAFLFLMVVIAVISSFCFYVTGRLGSSTSEIRSEKLIEDGNLASDEKSYDSWEKIFILSKQLVFASDFLRVVLTNFVHTCRSVAHMNFASIATDLLIPQSILPKGSWQLSVFFAFCTMVPQILVITNEKLLLRHGAYKIMMFGCFISMCSAFLYLFSSSAYVIMFFMLLDSICVHSTAPLFNILFAEFIEDDTARHERRNTMSSLVFSLNALMVKPAVSIAPVVIVYFLNTHGYETYQKDGMRTEELKRCMLRIIFTIPALLGLLQCLIFRRYSLRHEYTTQALRI
ncbi:MFS/sugar transport protein domain-containing protein [Ditylenchus destructor]|uniref:MFS/sugar transport protein domain-containing protein n=1 Tax=Ditylenchus destructor TaxID=166010 RepID=A0AAD4NF22_9BILA|nr:MFS/sugar transport protein domain-containing protein [Ditylenchus destructor]